MRPVRPSQGVTTLTSDTVTVRFGLRSIGVDSKTGRFTLNDQIVKLHGCVRVCVCVGGGGGLARGASTLGSPSPPFGSLLLWCSLHDCHLLWCCGACHVPVR